MNELTLTWQEGAQTRTQKINDRQPSKNPGTVRFGRDPNRCDVVLSHPTVSGLHVEFYFHPLQRQFWLRNLRSSNPPLVDGCSISSEVALRQGILIHLGQVELQVNAIALTELSIPPTVIMPPPVAPAAPINPAISTAQNYGLQCPRCQKISPYDRIALGCKWCGTSLAAAASVLIK